MSDNTSDFNVYLQALLKGDTLAWPEDIACTSAQVIGQLKQLGLAPLLYYLFNTDNELATLGWPSEVREFVLQAGRQMAIIDMLAERELQQVFAVLDGKNIAFILFKGTPLSFSVYPKTGLRVRGDTDILVPKELFSDAIKALEEMGYERSDEDIGKMVGVAQTLTRKGAMGVSHCLDVHHKISSHFAPFGQAFDFERLMAVSVPVQQLGENARTLNHCDAIILAAFHRAVHLGYTGELAIWLYDIHLLAAQLSEDQFISIYATVERLGIEALFSHALIATRQWFATDLPEFVESRMNTPPSGEISRGLLADDRAGGIKGQVLTDISGIQSLAGKSAYIRQRLFPPVPYIVKQYKLTRRWLIPFCYVHRAFFAVYVILRR